MSTFRLQRCASATTSREYEPHPQAWVERPKMLNDGWRRTAIAALGYPRGQVYTDGSVLQPCIFLLLPHSLFGCIGTLPNPGD